MLHLDDPRWAELKAGYRVVIDLRPVLRNFESGEDIKSTWYELWNELHHQGDVGEGSYTAVPHLVRIYRMRGVIDWNVYAIVAVIELAREEEDNPEVPEWTFDAYNQALQELGKLGLKELPNASDPDTIQSILALVAIVYGARGYGRILLRYSEEELLEIEAMAMAYYKEQYRR